MKRTVAGQVRSADDLAPIVHGLGCTARPAERSNVDHPGPLLPKERILAGNIWRAGWSVVRIRREACERDPGNLASLIHERSPSIRTTQGAQVLHSVELVPEEGSSLGAVGD